MSRYSTHKFAAAVTVSMLSASAPAFAANDNPCFQNGHPHGSVYWATGKNGKRCEPFNTYHATQHDPLAAKIDPNLIRKHRILKSRTRRHLGKRERP